MYNCLCVHEVSIATCSVLQNLYPRLVIAPDTGSSENFTDLSSEYIKETSIQIILIHLLIYTCLQVCLGPTLMCLVQQVFHQSLTLVWNGGL